MEERTKILSGLTLVKVLDWRENREPASEDLEREQEVNFNKQGEAMEESRTSPWVDTLEGTLGSRVWRGRA